jgi:hypothetical protein
MRANFLLCGLAALVAFAAPALAKGINQAEAKRVFFGLDMGGIYEPDGSPWRECIERNGATRYWAGGDMIDEGKLTVRDNGEVCFSYKSSDYRNTSCFTADRVGKGWRFTSVNDPTSVFLATQARPVKSCPSDQTPGV